MSDAWSGRYSQMFACSGPLCTSLMLSVISCSHSSFVSGFAMPDFATARRMMVDCQVRTYDVTDQNLLAAMLAVPREKFVPAELASVGYLDMDVPVAKGRRLLKPMVLAKLIQAAAIRPNDRVLDVG